MLLRDLAGDDLEPVLALNNQSVPALNPLDVPELARLVDLTMASLVAEVDGAFAGFCMVMPPGVDYASLNYSWFSAHAGELGYGAFAYLDRIAVAPSARRLGVGRAFYDRLVVELQRAGAGAVLRGERSSRNDASLAFHEAVGFREVGQQDTDGGAKRVSLLALDLI